MKPSERAKALNLVDYVLTIHDKTPDGESCVVTGGFSALGVQAVIDALEAAEREAFEAGVRISAEGRGITYDKWRRDRDS